MTAEFPSQIGQDCFVVAATGSKRGGTFLDLGAHMPKATSNTWHLEKMLGWRGVAVDCDPSWAAEWKTERPASCLILADAITVDYPAALDSCDIAGPVDYLSLDLEPPAATLACLHHVLSGGLVFRTVTFETDHYRDPSTRGPSRELMAAHGYVLARAGVCGVFGEQDDFYVHPDLC